MNHVEVKPLRSPEYDTPGFTPGPWKIARSGYANTPAVVFAGVCPPKFGSKLPLFGVTWVAEVRDDESLEHREYEANARLIAAAPEGYHAVVELLNAIHDSMTHESQRFHADAINAALAYLAKAGGAL